MRRVLLVSVLSFLFFSLASPVLAGIGPPPLDHFNVYLATGGTPPAVTQPITVVDQFGGVQTSLGAARFFLVPADKNDEGIVDPFSHLTCYPTSDPIAPPPEVISTNQFGVQTLSLDDSTTFCVPSEKLIAPGPVNLDHYQCYPASGPLVQLGVSIQDQFQVQSAVVLSPFLFCNPADKNGEGITNPLDHLTCYDYSPSGQPAGPIPISNQFFPDSDSLDVGSPFALCAPSQKEIPQDSLDHFSVYKALGSDGPIVQIDDQFGTQVTDLGLLDLFLVPADKNMEGIDDPISHLSCYEISEGFSPVQTVLAQNQFGEQVIDLGAARELCVPTEKLLTPGPVDVDHFKCYDASGDPLAQQIGWQDQFQGWSGSLLEPILFCNPAAKNGEAIQNDVDHLACFRLSTPGDTPSFPIPILNQFLPAQEDIQLVDTLALCVPSQKVVPPQVPGFSPVGVALLALAIVGAATLIRRRAAV